MAVDKKDYDEIKKKLTKDLLNSKNLDFRLAVARVMDLEGVITESNVGAITTSIGSFSTPTTEAFPVNSIFWCKVGTNPNTLLGYGLWIRFGEGTFIVSQLDGDSDFGTLLGTGGSKTSTISSHAGCAVAQHGARSHSGTAVAVHSNLSHAAHSGCAVTSHSHQLYYDGDITQHSYTTTSDHAVTQASTHADHTISAHSVTQPDAHPALSHSVTQANDHSAISILPPYTVAAVWIRTA